MGAGACSYIYTDIEILLMGAGACTVYTYILINYDNAIYTNNNINLMRQCVCVFNIYIQI